jgi:uncharacterized protein (TIGR02217 family)
MGGPTFNTTINTGFSGYEQRNRNWSQVRGKFMVNLISPPPSQFTGTQLQWLDLIHSFFLNVGGRADGFRFYDHKDNQATGQQIGVGDGSTLGPYQLVKVYTTGSRSYTRLIQKPITAAVNDYQGNALVNTVIVYDNGVVVSSAFYTVNATTGYVNFLAGHARAINHVITADCQFHYPVRFDTDDWQIEVEESNVLGGNPIVSVSQGQLALLELRIAQGQASG